MAAMVLVLSCEPIAKTSPSPLESPSTTDSVKINISASYPIKTLDAFVYSDTWTRELQSHFRKVVHPVQFCDVVIESFCQDKRLVFIANSPYEFNLESLKHYDSIELLQMNYADENPDYPLMSAVCTSMETSVSLSPLLCPVDILSINNLTGARLRNPRLHLSGINPKAEVLRFSGFRPSETLDSPDELRYPQMMFQRLPQDIGLFCYYPKIRLFCYPNDSRSESIGTPRTSVVFEADTLDSQGNMATVVRNIELPAIRRGGSNSISLDIW